MSDAERAVDELARSEEEFRALADHLPLMVWVHDADGAQQFVNQTFCDYFGVEREDMKAQRWQLLVHPDDRDGYSRAFVEAVAERRSFRQEVRAQRADGTWRWIESWGRPRFAADGTYLGHVGASTDITARRRAEQRLAAEAAFTDRVLDNLVTFAGVLRLDGTVVTANRAPLELAGLTLDDVVDRPFWECWWWCHDPDTMAELRRAIERAGQGTIVRYDVDVQIAGGRLLAIDFQVAPLRDDDGAITHLVVSGIDLTARKAAEAVVERTLAAERAARLRSERLEAAAVALAAAVDVHDVAQAIVDAIGDDDSETLSVLIARDGKLTPVALAGMDDDTESGRGAVRIDDDGPIAAVFRHGSPIALNDGATFDRLFPDHLQLRRSLGFEAAYVLPLIATDGEPLGVLIATSPDAGRYDDDRRAFLAAVAAQAGGTLERARLHEQAEKQHRLETRARARAEVIAHTLTEIEGTDQVGHQVARLAEILVPRVADWVSIEDPALTDPVLALAHTDPAHVATLAALRRRHRLGSDHPASVSHVTAGMPHRQSGLTAEMRSVHTDDEDAKALLERLGCHSYVAVPLDLGPSRPGVLLCGLSAPERRPYDQADEAFLGEIAQRAGAIMTATALREQEHDSSLRLQKALLPDRLKDHPAIDIAARYEAAASSLSVGGDWYDSFVWADRFYGLVIGDVVGHGIDAAAAMGRLRAASAILITSGEPHPVAMLEAIERCARGPDGIDFLTAFAAVIDTDTGRIVYASAGHPPALVIRSNGEAELLGDGLSAPICSLRVEARPCASRQLDPEDVVVAFTDGLAERRDRSLHDGLGQLTEMARSLDEHDVEDLNNVLIHRMAGDGDDDVVVVSMRFTPTGDRFRMRFPARRSELAPLRHSLSAWLERRDVEADLRQRIVLATGEACANAIEHAYRDLEPGDVGVRAGWDGDALVVVVNDAGIWQEARTSSVNRGRGLTIIGRVTDTMTRVSGPTGTTLTMRFVASPPDQPLDGER